LVFSLPPIGGSSDPKFVNKVINGEQQYYRTTLRSMSVENHVKCVKWSSLCNNVNQLCGAVGKICDFQFVSRYIRKIVQDS